MLEKDDPALYFNAAQAAYAQKDYETAAALYRLSPDNADKYINLGNAAFYLGENAGDMDEKMQLYFYALENCYQGILLYPGSIPLKYNYEFIKQKIEEMLENMEQESGEDSQDGEEGEEQESEAQEGEEQEAETQESQEQEQGTANESEEIDPDDEAIERILMMLEAQEEQSLKNNQEVMDGEDGTYGW
jgi:Ca-activated chloride channel family protein